MTKRRPIPPSEAQINAEALANRGRTYAGQYDASVKWAYDYHRREPRDLREATRIVRAAYADEVPLKLHDHQIGEGGTPQMTAAAVRYLDSPGATDAPPGERPLVSHYLTPFRAALTRLENGSPSERRRARIVRHVTVGAMSPAEAARAERAHPDDAKDVAWLVLSAFIRTLSDLRIDANVEAA